MAEGKEKTEKAERTWRAAAGVVDSWVEGDVDSHSAVGLIGDCHCRVEGKEGATW